MSVQAKTDGRLSIKNLPEQHSTARIAQRSSTATLNQMRHQAHLHLHLKITSTAPGSINKIPVQRQASILHPPDNRPDMHLQPVNKTILHLRIILLMKMKRLDNIITGIVKNTRIRRIKHSKTKHV